jgi:GDP-L-fucose synthase
MKRILVTGGTGMIGTALKQHIPDATFVSSREANLTSPTETLSLIADTSPTHVIHLAARVGGVQANMDNLGSFYYDNVMINTNVLESCRVNKVEKVLSLLSTCVYPDGGPYPLKEEYMHLGPPHESNYGYAYAKRMAQIQSRAYRHQYGCNFITAIPNNLFGENDYFDLHNSHVIPAMIRKIYEAGRADTDVALWGDGMVYREFTYSSDLAKILILLLDNYEEETPINVGSTEEHLIKDVAEKICNIFDFKNDIIWDTAKPKGQHKKPSDDSKLNALGYDQYTSFDVGLQNTCKWFEANYNNLRGK